MKVYLHQFLSRTGAFESKKDVLNALRNREIKVGGTVVVNPRYQLKPGKKTVFWNDALLEPIVVNTYVVLNKPDGYLSSRLSEYDRQHNKKSVFELFAGDKNFDDKTLNTLFCVGRLDEDTSGLLVLTNDGFLGSRITNPKNKIKKTYDVLLDKPVTEEDIMKLESGVIIDLEENGVVTKYQTKGCRIRARKGDMMRLSVDVFEGRKREVRRMFNALGKEVLKLERTMIGSLRLKDLKIKKGEYVLLEKKFIEERVINTDATQSS